MTDDAQADRHGDRLQLVAPDEPLDRRSWVGMQVGVACGRSVCGGSSGISEPFRVVGPVSMLDANAPSAHHASAGGWLALRAEHVHASGRSKGRGTFMAELVTIDGHPYLKRNPLGVLGLSIITLGIYWIVWYYKINVEIQRAENDQTMSPMRSLMAMIFGWLIIVPPFIAIYNTAKHVRDLETRLGIQQTLEPAIALVLMFVFSIGNGIYMQDHLNRAWDAAVTQSSTPPSLPVPPTPPTPPLPPMPA